MGSGAMAATMTLTAASLAEAQITAIASSDSKRAQSFAERFGIPHISSSALELASRSDVDAIYIANRPSDHVKAAMAAIHAGKPVLLEKPFAITAEQGAALVAEARARRCLLVENLWCLSLPAYRELAARFESGEYGKAVHLNFDFGYPMDPAAHPSLFDITDGGVLRDRAVYGVSLALQLLGPVQTLRSSVLHNSKGLDVAAALQLTHVNGAVSQLAFAINALMSNSATLACTRGALRLNAPTIGAEAISAGRMSPLTALDALKRPGGKGRLVARLKTIPALRRLNRWRSALRTSHHPYGPGPYRPVLEHFCELVRTTQTESPLMPLDLSLNTLRLVEAARHADHSSLEI